jgi:hypothetical protein
MLSVDREEMKEWFDDVKALFRGSNDEWDEWDEDMRRLLREGAQDDEDGPGGRQVNGVGEDDSEYESDDDLEEDVGVEARKVRDYVAL